LGRVRGAVVLPVKNIVDNHNRPVPETQRTPSDGIIAVVPMHPGRPPNGGWNPIPAKGCPPVPAAVPVNNPTPRIMGYPRPTDDRVPHPAAVMVGTPVAVDTIRNPDIAIGRFVNPSAGIGQFDFVFVEFGRQVLFGHVLGQHFIPGIVPLCKVVIKDRIIRIVRFEKSLCSDEAFVLTDNKRSFLSCRLDSAFVDTKLCLQVLDDGKTVKSLLKHIKRSIGRVYLKVLLSFQKIDP
jgi:hypothetical protein